MGRFKTLNPKTLQPSCAEHMLVRHCREALPQGLRVELLVEKEPVLLDVEIGAVLQEIRRLLPGEDPTRVMRRQILQMRDIS